MPADSRYSAEVEVALGHVPNYRHAKVFGADENVISDGTDQTIWQNPAGGRYVFPTAAEPLNIVSTDAADADPGGTGLHDLIIEGLDADGDTIQEAVAMNGIIPVQTTQAFVRVNRFIGTTSGAFGSNVGEVSAEQATSGLVVAWMGPDTGRAFQAVFTVPKFHQAIVGQIQLTLNKGAGQDGGIFVFAELRINAFDFEVIRQQFTIAELHTVNNPQYDWINKFPTALAQLTDVQLISRTTTTNITLASNIGALVARNEPPSSGIQELWGL